MMRTRLLFYFFSLLLVCIIGKLFIIQILASDKYTSNSYLQTQKIMPERGQIYDRLHEPLALNQTTYQLFAEPKKISNKEKVINQIDSVLHIGEATLEAKIDMTKVWLPIASSIPRDIKSRIENLHLDGIGFSEESQRFYPESSLSAHLLGFVGKQSDGEDQGYFGLEGYYDKDLTGIPGILKTERDLFGNPIVIGVQDQTSGDNGRDLISTIDLNVQRIAKNHLKDGMNRYGAKEGCAIVADPNTMEILALTCLPDYSPVDYWNYSQSLFEDPAISELYEPGSIFKPLVMAAAIQENVVKPDDTMDETGPTKIGEYQIQTWDNTYAGVINMTQILEKSSNVGMVYVGQKLGDKKLLEYLTKFGLGKTTGIDLQGEASGFMKGPNDWYPIDYATATFGQGIVVTPIQMITAFSSIINGGYMMTPHIVKSIESVDGEENTIKPEIKNRVINDRASMLIRKMLQSTVEHGEVKYNIPDGYTVGGKTGTAQIPIAGHYDPSKTIASFVGFAPVDKPKFIVLVSLKEPSSSIYGSETAAPIFFDIARDLFVYYNIPAE